MDLGQRAVDVGEATAGRRQEEVLDPLVIRREDADRRGEGDGVEHGLLVGELVEELAAMCVGQRPDYYYDFEIPIIMNTKR